MTTEFPEHERVLATTGLTRNLQEFLEWLRENKQLRICAHWPYSDTYDPCDETHEELIEEFLGINIDKLDDEAALLHEEDSWKHGRTI